MRTTSWISAAMRAAVNARACATIGAIGCVLMPLGARSAGAEVAPLSATLASGWRIEHSGASPWGRGAVATPVVAPRLGFAAGGEHTTLRAAFEARLETVADAVPQPAKSWEGVAQRASANFARHWTPLSSLELAADYRSAAERVTSAEAATLDEAMLTPGRAVIASGAGAAQVPWAEGAYVGTLWYRARAGEPDGGAACLWNVAVLPLRGAANALLLDRRARRFRTGSGLALWTEAVELGVRHAPESGRFVGTLECGPGEVHVPGRTQAGPAARVALRANPSRNGRVSADAEFQAGLATLSNIEWRQPVGTGGWALRAQTSIEVAGPTLQDLAVVRRLTVAVHDTLARATIVTLEGGGLRALARTDTRRLADRALVALTLVRRVRPWMQLGARWTTVFEGPTAARTDWYVSRSRFDAFWELRS